MCQFSGHFPGRVSRLRKPRPGILRVQYIEESRCGARCGRPTTRQLHRRTDRKETFIRHIRALRGQVWIHGRSAPGLVTQQNHDFMCGVPRADQCIRCCNYLCPDRIDLILCEFAPLRACFMLFLACGLFTGCTALALRAAHALQRGSRVERSSNGGSTGQHAIQPVF